MPVAAGFSIRTLTLSECVRLAATSDSRPSAPWIEQRTQARDGSTGHVEIPRRAMRVIYAVSPAPEALSFSKSVKD